MSFVAGTNFVRDDLANYAPASNLSLNEHIRNLQKDGHEIFHFAFGQSPFPVLEELQEQLKNFTHVNDYLPVTGTAELRESVCKFHEKYDNLTNLHPDHIITGPGSKQLILLLLLVFKGDVYLPSPSWTTYGPQCVLAGHSKPHIVTTSYESGWKITPDVLDKCLSSGRNESGNKLLIFNNPDNPTGICYTRNELDKLSTILRKHSCIVLSDEIYARLHYCQNFSSMAHFYPEGTIISTGMSKWASAGGWRVGYQIFPSNLVSLAHHVKSASSHAHSCCPAPMQFAVTKCLNQCQPEIQRYITVTSTIMRVIAAHCHRELVSVGVKCHPAEAGYYIFPDFGILKPRLKDEGNEW